MSRLNKQNTEGCNFWKLNLQIIIFANTPSLYSKIKVKQQKLNRANICKEINIEYKWIEETRTLKLLRSAL